MADYSQGDIVRDYITALDASYNGVTGAEWGILEVLDPDGEGFSLSIEEIGDGSYRVSFLAEKVGTYYWRVITNDTTPPTEYDAIFVVGPFSLYGAATGLAATGVTLLELIRMVASDLGDYLELTATSDGSADGSTFADELQLSTIPSATLRGSSFLAIGPSNYGIDRRILDSSDDATILTFKPNFPDQFLVGDVGWVTNLHSKGFWKSQYIAGINNGIRKSHPRHLVPVSYTYPDTFNTTDPVIPLPQHITHIYGVVAYSTVGQFWDIPMSHEGMVYGEGWAFDQASGGIILGGTWVHTLHGWNIQIKGYGRPATLLNLDDITTVDPSWLVPLVAGSLRWSKGDQKRFPEAANFDSRSDMWLAGNLSMTAPNTIRVR